MDWVNGIENLEQYGWKLSQKKPIIIIEKINNIGDKYLFNVKLNLEKFHIVYEDIINESYKIKQLNKHGINTCINIYLPEYVINKHKYLCKFFEECKNNKDITKNNSYYQWIKKNHKMNIPQDKKYFDVCFDKKLNDARQCYRWTKNKKEAIDLAKKYKNYFINIQNNGFYQPWYIPGPLKLPGITDQTNRYAMLKVLNYKTIELIVNKGTYDIMKKYDLIILD